MSFEAIPAIDLCNGRVVRLMQGDFKRSTTYAMDAHVVAARYAQAGARWLHVVDLDGAREGALANLQTIEAIARQNLLVQAGGGVREECDLQRLFDVGVARVVIGSVAVREPERAARWLSKFGAERIVIALDTRYENSRWTLPVAGWCESSVRTLNELVLWYAAHDARHLLCTDISCDGMLVGCNVELYRHLSDIAPQLAVQGSGGVRAADDLHALRAAGTSAAILGRALLEDCFTVEEALLAAGAA